MHPFLSSVVTVSIFLSIQLDTCLTQRQQAGPTSVLRQDDLDHFAKNIQLNFSVVTNSHHSEKRYLAELILTNNGQRTFPGAGWEVIFSQISLLEPDSYPYPNGVEKPESGVRFFFLMGNVYRMVPTESFGVIPPGSSKTIQWVNEYSNVARTDNFPNWYIAAPNLQARVFESTRGEDFDFVAPYDRPEKWKRFLVKSESDYDLYNPYSALKRMQSTAVEDRGTAPIPVLPTPINVEVHNDQATVNVQRGSWVVVTSARMANEARYLADQWNLQMAVRAPIRNYINIIEGNVLVSSRSRPVPTEESYEVRVDPRTQTITVRAAQPAGAFYAVQTLISLADRDGNVPETVITDGPRYRYRGLMLDVARNFYPKEAVFRVIDLMSMYKLNKLHLHLTDDEGWRLAIPGLEELTEVGATRCHDLSETKCLLPFLGSGPFPGPPGSGYYTVEDYRAILRYAQSRHVEVIPEIDMPGHAHAAVKAMEARYKRLVNLNVSEASRFLLSDLADESVYLSVQSFSDDAINPCLRSTYTFVSRVLNALFAMHRDISPLRMFHFGGDEVAKGAWEKSPVCTRLRESGVASDLQQYMASQVANMTSLYNLDLAAWEDGLSQQDGSPMPRNALPNRNVYIYAWNNVFEFGTARRAYDYANNGYKVILAPATNLYLDHPYEPDPEERGLYWATRCTDTKRVFSVNPEHIYWNAKEYRSGKKLAICRNVTVCPPLTEPNNIEGIQASLFGELIRNQQVMDSMILPRLLAAAERAWHAAAWEWQDDDDVREEMINQDWTNFANTVGYKELARLDRLGYKYRIPVPGAAVEDDVMMTSVEFPGLVVEISSDDGVTWTPVRSQGEQVDTSKQYLLRTKSAWGTRYSRVVSLFQPKNTGSSLRSTTSSLAVVAMATTTMLHILILHCNLY